MLLVCPVRPGDKNEELRFALRSWEANLHLPDGLVLMTVGYCPSWLAPDYHVDGNVFTSAPLAVFDNVRLGAQHALAHGFDDVLYMNDDFFCLDPMTSVAPVKRNWTLDQHVARAGGSSVSHWWARSLALTASWLRDEGFPHPDSYEVHRPFPASATAMLGVHEKWRSAKCYTEDAVPQWRTAYGVLTEMPAFPVHDGKLGRTNTGFGLPWVSTADETWRVHGRLIMPRFQKPSRWEIA